MRLVIANSAVRASLAITVSYPTRAHGIIVKYMSGFIKKDAKELRPKWAFFFSPEAISEDDDIKIGRKVSPFFLPLPVYLPFIAVFSPFFARLHGLEAA